MPKEGIRDWKQKLRLFKGLLDVTTRPQFVDTVVKGANWRQADIDAIKDRLPKWNQSRPMQAPGPAFFSLLADKLPTRDIILGQLLIELSIAEYVERLPKDDPAVKAVLKHQGLYTEALSSRPTAPAFRPSSPRVGRSGLYSLWSRDGGPDETIKTGIDKGLDIIDQRHFYVNANSAQAWSALVGTDAYPTYKDCKQALEALVSTDEWLDAIQLSQPRTIVMLAGGGAPTKDLVLLLNLKDQPYITGPVRLYLLDISWFMLTSSRRSILEHAHRLGFAPQVEVKVIQSDIFDMAADEAELFHETGNVLFCITAGTIGNLDESAFFRALGRVSVPGDLLVISADTIDDPSPHDEGDVSRKYDNSALRQFLRPVVEEVLGAAHSTEPVDETLARMEPRLLKPGEDGNPSQIPDSHCLVVKLTIKNRPITLVTSTRYKSSSLQAFAARFQWESICQASRREASHFKQFLFRKY